jgi:hypothetical protein
VTSSSGRPITWDTAWAAWKYGLFVAVDESSRRQIPAKALGTPSVPFPNKGASIRAKVAAMTQKRLSGRSGFTMSHSAILLLLICIQSKLELSDDFKGHDSSSVYASGDEKDKIAKAAAVPQIASLSSALIGPLNRLLRRAVL